MVTAVMTRVWPCLALTYCRVKGQLYPAKRFHISFTTMTRVFKRNIRWFCDVRYSKYHVRFLSFFCCRDPHDKIPPMDPAKLEYFRTVKEITGRGRIKVTTLSFSHLLRVDCSFFRVSADPGLARESNLTDCF